MHAEEARRIDGEGGEPVDRDRAGVGREKLRLEARKLGDEPLLERRVLGHRLDDKIEAGWQVGGIPDHIDAAAHGLGLGLVDLAASEATGRGVGEDAAHGLTPCSIGLNQSDLRACHGIDIDDADTHGAAADDGHAAGSRVFRCLNHATLPKQL